MKAIAPVSSPVLVELVDGQPTTTSLDVAAHFRKLHKTVLRAIANLECSPEFTQHNFVPSEYTDSTGRKLTQYRMTRDGFTFLCMGFTGKEAAKWKEAYINAFNQMEHTLKHGAPAKAKRQPKQITDGLTTDQQDAIKALVKARVDELPEGKRAKAAVTCWSSLKSKFGCTYKDIAPERFTEAVSLIARVTLEGEWLGKESKPQPNLDFPIETLIARRPSMLTIRNSEQAWLDVTLHDLRDIRGDETPCEKLLNELHKAGHDIEGCWWELRTYRNKVRELASFAIGMNRVIEDPHRYSVKPNGDKA